MNLIHKRSQTVYKTKPTNNFSTEQYLSSPNPSQYLTQVLKNTCAAKRINVEKMNMKQMEQIISILPIKLKTKQLHELFLYVIYDPNIKNKTNQKPTISISNLVPNKINISAMANWIHSKIGKNQLHNCKPKTARVSVRSSMQQGYSLETERSNVLPKIKTKPQDRFRAELTNVLNIFSQMQRERQSAGLEPVCLQDDEKQIHEIPNKEGYYDGDFFEVNAKLNRLRSQAQLKIQQIISASKQSKTLQKKFEEALIKYQKVRNNANQKIGRCGAMKAHKRMIDKRTEQIRKIDKWKQDTGNTEFVRKYY